eukprot:1963128-Amphidinium_carterae.1
MACQRLLSRSYVQSSLEQLVEDTQTSSSEQLHFQFLACLGTFDWRTVFWGVVSSPRGQIESQQSSNKYHALSAVLHLLTINHLVCWGWGYNVRLLCVSVLRSVCAQPSDTFRAVVEGVVANRHRAGLGANLCSCQHGRS